MIIRKSIPTESCFYLLAIGISARIYRQNLSNIPFFVVSSIVFIGFLQYIYYQTGPNTIKRASNSIYSPIVHTKCIKNVARLETNWIDPTKCIQNRSVFNLKWGTEIICNYPKWTFNKSLAIDLKSMTTIFSF